MINIIEEVKRWWRRLWYKPIEIYYFHGERCYKYYDPIDDEYFVKDVYW